MSSIRAVVVDSDVPGQLAIKEVEASKVSPSEALVQVEAISLKGEQRPITVLFQHNILREKS